MNEPLVSVVIPTRRSEKVSLAVDTLMGGTHQHLEIIIVVDHEQKRQSWVRNEGLARATGRYVLFSDSDIKWEEHAVEYMLHALLAAQRKSEPVMPEEWRYGYAYCGFRFTKDLTRQRPDDLVLGMRDWDWQALRQQNYISTMSLFDREVCGWPLAHNGHMVARPFDEDLHRLEDWSLYLTLGERNVRGAWTKRLLFATKIKAGVSFENPLTQEQAQEMVWRKHGIEVVKP